MGVWCETAFTGHFSSSITFGIIIHTHREREREREYFKMDDEEWLPQITDSVHQSDDGIACACCDSCHFFVPYLLRSCCWRRDCHFPLCFTTLIFFITRFRVRINRRGATQKTIPKTGSYLFHFDASRCTARVWFESSRVSSKSCAS